MGSGSALGFASLARNDEGGAFASRRACLQRNSISLVDAKTARAASSYPQTGPTLRAGKQVKGRHEHPRQDPHRPFGLSA
jgi:hypothetical protein